MRVGLTSLLFLFAFGLLCEKAKPQQKTAANVRVKCFGLIIKMVYLSTIEIVKTYNNIEKPCLKQHFNIIICISSIVSPLEMRFLNCFKIDKVKSRKLVF